MRSWFREPWVINAAQCGVYAMVFIGGMLTALGGLPNLVTGTIGQTMAVMVGVVLAIGGTVGVSAVIAGHWWIERIALLIVAIGWFALLPATFFYVQRNTSVWLVITLIVGSLLSIYIRYRRIDWAYLNPAK